MQAAAALAALGDPAVFEVEQRALESPNRLTAMVAAKQLHAFADLDVDLDEAWARTLRPERPVVGEALARLAALPPERAATMKAKRAASDGGIGSAGAILARVPGPLAHW